MRKILFFLILFLPLFGYCQDSVTVVYFYSPHCKACMRLKEEFLPLVKAEYAEKVVWKEIDTDANQNNLLMLISLSGRNRRGGAVTPSALVGDVFLATSKEIEKKLKNTIERALEQKDKSFKIPALRGSIVDVFNQLSFFAVMGSGLIDGINPCAFAVIVFFVSFLAVYGYRKREIAWIGSFYCLSVFFTYLAIGLGLFKFFYALENVFLLIKLFYSFIAWFCFILAGFALYDYIKYKRTGETTEMILQLPSFLKRQINFIIGQQLRNRSTHSGLSLAFSAFVVGFSVSILEAVCTGQVYVPTIVFILKNTGLKVQAVSYLFLYNIMFILPLLVVFILSLLGFSSKHFQQFLKNNLAAIKIFMVFLFLSLGMLILWVS